MQEMIDLLNGMEPEQRAEVEKTAIASTQAMRWVPNPGPQTDAYFSLADQILYGGEAGGGKTDLLIGLAIQAHRRTLLLRRIKQDISWLVDRMQQILGSRKGYNGQDKRWKVPGGGDRLVEFEGLQNPGDEQRGKGRPKDLIGFDEATDFLESQVAFVLGWLRTTIEGQRCRVVFATNPPTTVEGEWIVRWFAPWVDKSHPLFPYPVGKLLWTCRGPEDDWVWFESPDDCLDDDMRAELVTRTFIRSGLNDNIDLQRSDYGRQLALMPEELRRRYRDGDFSAENEDDEWQVIPTEWIRQAQARWVPDDGVTMEAVGVDIAQGGKDKTVFAPRYTGKSCKYWVDKLKKWPGKETPDGKSVAGKLFSLVTDAAQINIDMGGGYGGSTYEHLNDAEMSVFGFVPSGESKGRTSDGIFEFVNMRAEAVWKVREMLDPNVRDKVALPPDPMLRADLASFRWKLMHGAKIQVMPKEEIKKLLGRSPDDGESVVISLATADTRVQPRVRERNPANRQKNYATQSRVRRVSR